MNKKQLQTVAKIIAGQSPESSTYNNIGDGLPFFQGKADFQAKYPKVRIWCNSKIRKEAEPGDILMSVRAPVGSVNICNQQSIVGRGLAAIRPNSNLNGEYLYYFLKSNEQKIASLGTGSTFKAITQETLKKIEIPLPPLDDQIRIAHLLGKVEGLIVQRKESLQQLDELLKSVFLEMFGDPVRNEKGWEKKPLSELCDFENGDRSSNYPSGDDIQDIGVLFLSSREIVNFRLALSNSIYISEKKFNSLSRGKCYTGDVLMVLRGAGLGKCCVFNGAYYKAFINAQMVILRCAENLNNAFLVEQVKNERMFRELLKIGSGSAQPQLTAAEVKKFKIVTPPIDLQNQFAAIVEKVDSLKSHYQQNHTRLENLYGVLSQKAFKGELDLSRVPLPQRTAQSLHEETNLPEQNQENPTHSEEQAEISNADLSQIEQLDIPAMSTAQGRAKLLGSLFESYTKELPNGAPLSLDDFWQNVQLKTLDYVDEDSEPLGLADYDLVKKYLFRFLETGEVVQTFNEDKNRIELQTRGLSG